MFLDKPTKDKSVQELAFTELFTLAHSLEKKLLKIEFMVERINTTLLLSHRQDDRLVGIREFNIAFDREVAKVDIVVQTIFGDVERSLRIG